MLYASLYGGTPWSINWPAYAYSPSSRSNGISRSRIRIEKTNNIARPTIIQFRYGKTRKPNRTKVDLYASSIRPDYPKALLSLQSGSERPMPSPLLWRREPERGGHPPFPTTRAVCEVFLINPKL